jgi:hypothetical protein
MKGGKIFEQAFLNEDCTEAIFIQTTAQETKDVEQAISLFQHFHLHKH